MTLEDRINKTFSIDEMNRFSYEHIANNCNPIFDNPNIKFEVLIPQYMLWVVKYGDNDGNLICDGTLSDLAFLGRSKNPEGIPYKDYFTKDQQYVITEFIEWCESRLSLPFEPVLLRVKKYW